MIKTDTHPSPDGIIRSKPSGWRLSLLTFSLAVLSGCAGAPSDDNTSSQQSSNAPMISSIASSSSLSPSSLPSLSSSSAISSSVAQSSSSSANSSTSGLDDRSLWTLNASHNTGELELTIDDDPSTRWATRIAQAGGEWLTIDLGAQYPFNTVVLNSAESPTDYPRGYEVFVSNDGINWGDAVQRSQGTAGTTTIIFEDANTRFIRIEQTGNVERYWWSIYELNVLQDDNAIAPPITPPIEPPIEPPVGQPNSPFDENTDTIVVENGIGWVEGPAWVPEESGFIYNLTDSEEPDVHRLWRPGSADTEEYWRVPGSNHGAIWSEGLIYMTNREPGRISAFDPETKEETILRDGLGRPNDLDRFSDGSLYFSDWPNGGRDGVWRLHMNGELEQVISASQIESPNGIAFSADCKSLYVVNTGQSVIAFDVNDSGGLSNQRVFADNLTVFLKI